LIVDWIDIEPFRRQFIGHGDEIIPRLVHACNSLVKIFRGRFAIGIVGKLSVAIAA
jgi:hypothetical protein